MRIERHAIRLPDSLDMAVGDQFDEHEIATAVMRWWIPDDEGLDVRKLHGGASPGARGVDSSGLAGGLETSASDVAPTIPRQRARARCVIRRASAKARAAPRPASGTDSRRSAPAM